MRSKTTAQSIRAAYPRVKRRRGREIEVGKTGQGALAIDPGRRLGAALSMSGMESWRSWSGDPASAGTRRYSRRKRSWRP